MFIKGWKGRTHDHHPRRHDNRLEGRALPSTLTDADSARIEAAIRAARSPQTQRAYASQWAAWGAWCASRGACPLPAAPFELAAYLAERAQSVSTSTVRMAKAAIVFVHKAKGEPSPVTDDVIEVMRGLAASKATEHGRVKPKPSPATILPSSSARAGEPRKLGRGMETAETAAERAQIDRAIAGVLFHAGLRRSEAADLRWGDVEPAASIPGALTIRVRTSKTNRDGEATDVRLAKNGAAAALIALRPANASSEALVFRGLNGQSIGRRFAAAANAAGVEGVTAHSGRVGLASELTAAGASTTETMLAGGWKTARMVAHYSAGASAERGAVAKYL